MVTFMKKDGPVDLIHYSIESSRDVEPVHTLGPIPDRSWRHTCICGLLHFVDIDYRFGGIERIIDEQDTYYCADCEEEHTYIVADHWACKRCGCRIVPRWTSTTPMVLRGLRRTTVEATVQDGIWQHTVAFPLTEEDVLHLRGLSSEAQLSFWVYDQAQAVMRGDRVGTIVGSVAT